MELEGGVDPGNPRLRLLAQQLSLYRSALARDAPIEVIDGGYRVAETETHHIDLIRAGLTWRVRETRKNGNGHDRIWVYALAGLPGFAFAANAVLDWDGSPGTAPAGGTLQVPQVPR